MDEAEGGEAEGGGAEGGGEYGEWEEDEGGEYEEWLGALSWAVLWRASETRRKGAGVSAHRPAAGAGGRFRGVGLACMRRFASALHECWRRACLNGACVPSFKLLGRA